MPWNGTGSFSRTNGTNTGSTTWTKDKNAGTKILSTRHDTHDQDLSDGINNCLAKDGQNAMTGDLDMGSNAIRNINDFYGNADFNDNVTIQGSLSATGGHTLSGGTEIYGAIDTYSGDLTVNDNALIAGNLTVSGTITNSQMPVAGTYSPTLTPTGSGSFTMLTQDGQYTTIGNLVICNIYVEATPNSPTGYILISLPETSNTINGAGTVSTHSGIDVEQGLLFESTASNAYGVLKKLGDDGFVNFVDCGVDVSGTVSLAITVCYFKA